MAESGGLPFEVNFPEAERVGKLVLAVANFAAEPFADKSQARAVHDAVTDRLRAVFQTEGAAGGQRWRALSVRYAAWKERNYPGRPLLVLTGRSKDSLLNRFHPEHVFAARGKRLVVGTDDPVPRYHQEGKGRLPERAVLTVKRGDPLTAAVANLFAAAARRHFGEGF